MNQVQDRVTITNPDNQGGSSEKSSIDKILGQHTTSVIVAILFVFTLIAFLIYIGMFKDKLSESITTGFISILSGLAGFFVASLKSSE